MDVDEVYDADGLPIPNRRKRARSASVVGQGPRRDYQPRNAAAERLREALRKYRAAPIAKKWVVVPRPRIVAQKVGYKPPAGAVKIARAEDIRVSKNGLKQRVRHRRETVMHEYLQRFEDETLPRRRAPKSRSLKGIPAAYRSLFY